MITTTCAKVKFFNITGLLVSVSSLRILWLSISVDVLGYSLDSLVYGSPSVPWQWNKHQLWNSVSVLKVLIVFRNNQDFPMSLGLHYKGMDKILHAAAGGASGKSNLFSCHPRNLRICNHGDGLDLDYVVSLVYKSESERLYSKLYLAST